MLGQGASSFVYLARHKKLKDLRAIKCLSKAHSLPPSLLQEASLLTNLNHPGIVKIFDVEEDSEYFYIIEEVAYGTPIEEYCRQQASFSEENVLDFGLQLCDILEYLHLQRPNPIVYLDLKPEHLIIIKDRIKLIDYGQAKRLIKGRDVYANQCTEGFTPPEIISGSPISERTDIYELGCVLYYLYYKEYYSGEFHKKPVNENLSRLTQKLLCKMLKKEPEKRFASMGEVKKEIAKAKSRLGEGQNLDRHLKKVKNIYVLGSAKRVGATWVSISLVSYLNSVKFNNAVYIEDNTSDFIRKLAAADVRLQDRQGIYKLCNFQGMPRYEEGVDIMPQKDYYIYDAGNVSSITQITDRIEDEALILVVIDGSYWEWQEQLNNIRALETLYTVRVIFNCENKKLKDEFDKTFCGKAYSLGRIDNPFLVNRRIRSFWEQVLK